MRRHDTAAPRGQADHKAELVATYGEKLAAISDSPYWATHGGPTIMLWECRTKCGPVHTRCHCEKSVADQRAAWADHVPENRAAACVAAWRESSASFDGDSSTRVEEEPETFRHVQF